MRYAYEVETIRSAESALMARVPEGALMRRAAAGLARRIALLLTDSAGGVYGAHVTLLVGAGDNGGDALYAGARLARRGARVEALLLGADRTHAGGLAALRANGGRVARQVPARSDLVVDGIVGIGGRGGLRPPAAKAVAAAALTGAPVVAVDVPSGVNPDTGEVEGAAVRADVTVTFGCLKPGVLIGEGATRAGLVDLVEIGLTPYLTGPAVGLPEAADIALWWPRAGAWEDKYSRGVLGVAAGSDTYPGAAVLAVGAGLAGPTGMVRYAGTAVDAVRTAYPEVVGTPGLAAAGRVQCWAVGSGLGTSDEAAAVLRQALQSDLPVLIDADGITLLADRLEWVRTRKAPTLLTPHDREFARVFGPVGPDRLTAARRAAADLRCTVLLKGDRTIVAGRDGEAFVNPTGTPALATAGSGDVLTGLAGSLLAGGVSAVRAATAAAYVHGMAARIAASTDGRTATLGFPDSATTAGRRPISATQLRDALPAAVAAALSAP